MEGTVVSTPSWDAEATVAGSSSWVGGLGKGAKETGNLGAESAVVCGGGGLAWRRSLKRIFVRKKFA